MIPARTLNLIVYKIYIEQIHFSRFIVYFVRLSYTDGIKILEKNNKNFEFKVSVSMFIIIGY